VTLRKRVARAWSIHARGPDLPPMVGVKALVRVALCGTGTRGYDDPREVTCRRCLKKLNRKEPEDASPLNARGGVAPRS